MQTTTIIRLLSSTDVAEKSAHGSEPPLPNKASITQEMESFFGGKEKRQVFIDVNTNRKYTLRMTDYKTSNTHHRIAPIGKFKVAYDLEVGDQIILEKVEKEEIPLYLIDYLKKASAVSVYGENRNKGLINEEKLAALMSGRIIKGEVIETAKGEYHFQGKNKNKLGNFILYCNAGKVTIDFDGKSVQIKGKTQYEFDFSKSIISFSELSDWKIEKGKAVLFKKFSDKDYIEEDEKIRNDIDASDLIGIGKEYTAAPMEKEDLKKSNGGKKVYPRKKTVSINALKRADNQCEFNEKHKSFLRRNSNVKYMEPHHLIPLQYHEDFEWSLDVEANVVSLCSECHNRIHYGDGKMMLKRLWEMRKNELKDAGILISEDELLQYYGY